MRSALTWCCAISLLLLLSFLTHVPVLVTASTSTTDCSSLSRCLPWDVSPTCERGKPISLQFMLGLSPANYWTDTSTGTQYNYSVYSFCPNVDQLQSFTLKGAGLLTAGQLVDGVRSIYTPVQSTNLSIFGFGDVTSPKIPLPNTNGTVLVATQGYACGSASNVLMASILQLNIGLHKGKFNYLSSSTDRYQWMNNTHYNTTLCEIYTNGSYLTYNENIINATNSTNSTIDWSVNYCNETLWVTNGTYQLPAKTGFTPTCSLNKKGEDVCAFDADAPCIGAVPGAKNCAKCYANATALASASIQIWTAYYGSDKKSVTLLSGGSNPMTYYKFAGGDIFTNIASQLDAIANTVSNQTGKINISGLNTSGWYL